MVTWLVENWSTVLFILGLAAFGLGVGWWMTRKRAYLYALGGVLGLAALYGLFFLFGLFSFGLSDEKQMQRAIEDMTGSVAKKDIDQIFAHISDSFHAGNFGKEEFRKMVEVEIKSGAIEDVKVWDFSGAEASRKDRTGKINFLVKGKGRGLGEDFYRCETVFVLEKGKDPATGKEGDQWRLKSFRLFAPQADPKSGQASPVFP